MRSLYELSETELRELLMSETKKFTSSMRSEWSADDRAKIRHRIEEIQRALEAKSNYHGPNNFGDGFHANA